MFPRWLYRKIIGKHSPFPDVFLLHAIPYRVCLFPENINQCRRFKPNLLVRNANCRAASHMRENISGKDYCDNLSDYDTLLSQFLASFRYFIPKNKMHVQETDQFLFEASYIWYSWLIQLSSYFGCFLCGSKNVKILEIVFALTFSSALVRLYLTLFKPNLLTSINNMQSTRTT